MNIVSWAADTARRSVGKRQFISARKEGRIRTEADLGLGPFARCHPDSSRRPAITIGSHVFVDCTLVTKGEGRIVIGSNCWIGGAGTTAIGSVASIEIGSDVIISNNVHIYDHNSHPTDPAARRRMTRGEFFGPSWQWTESASEPVIIEDNVWIGEYSMVLKGVTVGSGSIVAAHAVVTKDVQPYTIVAGNPARPVKKLL